MLKRIALTVLLHLALLVMACVCCALALVSMLVGVCAGVVWVVIFLTGLAIGVPGWWRGCAAFIVFFAFQVVPLCFCVCLCGFYRAYLFGIWFGYLRLDSNSNFILCRPGDASRIIDVGAISQVICNIFFGIQYTVFIDGREFKFLASPEEALLLKKKNKLFYHQKLDYRLNQRR